MSAVKRVCGACVVSKKKTKSCVWNEFGLRSTDDSKVIENEKNSPLCLTCGKSVQAKGSNTTNLWQHLREHHPSVYAEIFSHKAAKKPGECSTLLTLEESASKGTKYMFASENIYAWSITISHNLYFSRLISHYYIVFFCISLNYF